MEALKLSTNETYTEKEIKQFVVDLYIFWKGGGMISVKVTVPFLNYSDR